MTYNYDVERDVKQFNAAGADPLVARIILVGLFGRFAAEGRRSRKELRDIRQRARWALLP